MKLSEAKYEDAKGRLANEKKRLAILGDSLKAQLDSQTRTDRETPGGLRAEDRSSIEQMTIRAGTEGVLKEVNVEVGQRVAPGHGSGQNRAAVALEGRAEDSRDAGEGQSPSARTPKSTPATGIIKGKVMRIDPAAVNGTVTVDVKLPGRLPKDARPDLSVDGTIEIERLADVVYVGRPVFGQPNSQITLFRLEPEGKYADRVPVKLGRSSVNTIEILDGLKVGDQVILSDMSSLGRPEQNSIELTRRTFVSLSETKLPQGEI